MKIKIKSRYISSTLSNGSIVYYVSKEYFINITNFPSVKFPFIVYHSHSLNILSCYFDSLGPESKLLSEKNNGKVREMTNN